jgi:hypothetical protein
MIVSDGPGTPHGSSKSDIEKHGDGRSKPGHVSIKPVIAVLQRHRAGEALLF